MFVFRALNRKPFSKPGRSFLSVRVLIWLQLGMAWLAHLGTRIDQGGTSPALLPFLPVFALRSSVSALVVPILFGMVIGGRFGSETTVWKRLLGLSISLGLSAVTLLALLPLVQ